MVKIIQARVNGRGNYDPFKVTKRLVINTNTGDKESAAFWRGSGELFRGEGKQSTG